MSTCCPPQEVEDVFSYYQIKEHPKLLLAMTGLSHTEFDQLLRHFQYAWDQYVQNNYIDRDSRKRQYGAGRAESTLVNMEDKLLFILYYLKVYPLQEILAFEFDMAQSTANEWIHILSEVLKKALDHGGYVPERDPKQLGPVLVSDAESTYGIDGTERPRQRPRDAEKQKHYYSGKKKRTRSRTSLLVASIRAKSIICVKPMKANVMIKRLRMKKVPHTLQTSMCIKILAFKDMHQRE